MLSGAESNLSRRGRVRTQRVRPGTSFGRTICRVRGVGAGTSTITWFKSALTFIGRSRRRISDTHSPPSLYGVPLPVGPTDDGPGCGDRPLRAHAPDLPRPPVPAAARRTARAPVAVRRTVCMGLWPVRLFIAVTDCTCSHAKIT